MQSPSKSLTIPIGYEARKTAKTFAQQQVSKHKARQVYLNTLAVYAVHDYLNFMGIESSLETSDSWNQAIRLNSDTADLYIPNLKGRIECLPILTNEKVCHVPPEVWDDRLAYLVALIAKTGREVRLLGFSSSVMDGVLLLDQLQPLEELFKHLQPVAQQDNHKLSPNLPVTHLRQWLVNIFTEGWQDAQALLSPIQSNYAVRSRALPEAQICESVTSNLIVQRGKLINLGISLEDPSSSRQTKDIQVALVVEVKEENLQRYYVRLQVHPFDTYAVLPPDLKLQIIEESGELFADISSREADNFIQYQFWAQPDESFTVNLIWQSTGIRENFRI
ncbi:MAG: DUF1822 family protein [Xenococcaceae cyanobacterium]